MPRIDDAIRRCDGRCRWATLMACTVMVIEEDVDVRQAIADVLTDAGYMVAHAENGRAALNMLQGGVVRPCVLLLDLIMPDVDGWTFRSEQRREPGLAAIPVIVVSGVAPNHVPPEGAEPIGPVAAYLRKPIRLEQLVAAADLVCAGHQHARRE